MKKEENENKSNRELVLSFVGKGGIDEKKVNWFKKEWKKQSKKYYKYLHNLHNNL